MNNKKTYYIPVEISNIELLKVEATTELEAVALVEASIHNNNLRQRNDIVKIIREEIKCEQDDEMIESIKKDFDIEEYSYDYKKVIFNEEGELVETDEDVTVDGMCHEITLDGVGLPKFFDEGGNDNA